MKVDNLLLCPDVEVSVNAPNVINNEEEFDVEFTLTENTDILSTTEFNVSVFIDKSYPAQCTEKVSEFSSPQSFSLTNCKISGVPNGPAELDVCLSSPDNSHFKCCYFGKEISVGGCTEDNDCPSAYCEGNVRVYYTCDREKGTCVSKTQNCGDISGKACRNGECVDVVCGDRICDVGESYKESDNPSYPCCIDCGNYCPNGFICISEGGSKGKCIMRTKI